MSKARINVKKLNDIVSVRDYGAVGNGTTDDTAAVQAAIDFCKANPGFTLFFPRGSYLITTSLNCTYAGSAAGIDTGYYGFTVEGEDQINTYIKGETSGTPVWDLTGKPRMTFRNIGFANYTDGAHNPSCMLLLARNLTNSFAGGHVFERVSLRGYCTQTMVQTASSEVNNWLYVDFTSFKSGVSGLELTEQIETTVNSVYIDLSAHTFSGGNTRHVFVGCGWDGSVPSSGAHYVRCSGIDNAIFIGCYSNFTNGDAEFLFSDDCSNVSFQDHRGEGAADYHIRLAAGVTLRGLVYTGRSSTPIRGEDNSVFEDCEIRSTFMALGSGLATFSFDAWDVLNCDVYDLTNGARARNSARGTRFWDFKEAASWSLPTGDLTQPQEYGLAYTGGAINYRRRIYTQSKYERSRSGRQEINTLVLPETHIADLSSATYASGYTPDLDVASNFSFIVTGNVTVNNPSNADLGPGDTKGQMLILTFSQNGTGGYTVTMGSDYDLQSAVIPTAAFARVSLCFVYVTTSAGPKWVRVN